MEKIKIELDKEQYKAMIELLYIADYLANSGLVSRYKSGDARNRLFDLLEYFYSFGKQFGFHESLSLATITSQIPLSEKDARSALKNTETAIERGMWHLLAQEFAKRDLGIPQNNRLFDHEGGWMTKRELITKRMQIYLKEFGESGITNLRFKFLKQPNEVDMDE